MDTVPLCRPPGPPRWRKPPTTGICVVFTTVMILGILTIFTFFTRPSTSHPEVDDKLTQRLHIVNRTISSLERALGHLFLVGDGINLDAVFLVRLMEAQLMAFRRNVALQDLSSTKKSHIIPVLQQIKNLQENATRFLQTFITVVKKNQPAYYENMKFEFSVANWSLWYSARYIDRHDMPSYGFDKMGSELLLEKESDQCLKDLYSNQCHVSEECWKLMTFSFYNGYSLSHEILYLLNALALGCKNEVEVASQMWKNMSTDVTLAKEAAAVLHETELIANRTFPVRYRDLFMEQVTFGGILGYRDFFRDEWLEEIMSWQSEKGCYTLLGKRRAGNYSNNADPYPRKKRNTAFLEDGCEAHTTGVALTALGQFIRFVMEPLFLDDI